MAAQEYYGVVQQLYISYFGRPADYFGLRNFAEQLDAMDAPTEYEALAAAVEAGDNAGLTALVNSFNSSEESIALYGNDNSQLGNSRFIAAIYQNVLGREADAEGFDFWVNALQSGAVTKANAAASITAAALKLEGDDAQTVQNKLDVATAFTDALDTPSKFNAYAGNEAAAAARGLLQAVNNETDVDAYQANIDAAIAAIVNVAVPGKEFAFTAGIDNLIGTAGNDTFVATINDENSAASLFGPLDAIDGGAGNDTLSIAVTGSLAAAPTLNVKNVENLKVATTLNMGTADAAVDVSGIAFNTASLTAAGTVANVKVANTTDVTLTSAGAATLVGGKAVVVAAAGATNVSGAALTGVTVNGGTSSIVNNTATTGNGTTLTSVSLNDVAGTNVLTGNGLTTVNLSAIDTKGTSVTVNNATTGGHTLNLNLNAVGTKDDQIVVTDATATRVAVTTTASSNIALSAAAATTATVAGSAATTLNVAGSTVLASLDASAATGNVTVTGNLPALTSYKGGSAIDTISLGAAKYTVDTGAGNDVVTLTGAVAAGSTVNLGAGNDSLLMGTGGAVAVSTATAVTVIDGGDGFDTVSAGLLNAANAGQFKNFDALDLSAAANLDMNLVTGSTITGLTLSGNTVADKAAVLNNVKAGVGLSVAGVNAGTTTINVANATATDNTFGITFNGAAASAATKVANVDAGVVVLNGVETVTIASEGGNNTWNKVTLTDDALQTVTITGGKNLDLAFAGVNGTVSGTTGGVKMIDGSAATGALNINTANVIASGTNAGNAITTLNVKGGSAADTITLAGYATVNAGAGNDTIIVSKDGGILTGGAGNDTFNVKAAVATGVTEATSILTTITDLTAGDKIDLGVAGGSKFGATKVALGETVTNLDQALAFAAEGTDAAVTWFQYGADTYIVADKGDAGFNAGDVVVKLTGLVDLSTATIGADGIVTL